MKPQKRGRVLVELANGVPNVDRIERMSTPKKKPRYVSDDRNSINHHHQSRRSQNIGRRVLSVDDFDSDCDSNDTPSPALKGAIQSLDLDLLPKEDSASKCSRFLNSVKRPTYQPRAIFKSIEKPIDCSKELEEKTEVEYTEDVYDFHQLQNVSPEQPLPEENVSESSNSDFDEAEVDNALNKSYDYSNSNVDENVDETEKLCDDDPDYVQEESDGSDELDGTMDDDCGEDSEIQKTKRNRGPKNGDPSMKGAPQRKNNDKGNKAIPDGLECDVGSQNTQSNLGSKSGDPSMKGDNDEGNKAIPDGLECDVGSQNTKSNLSSKNKDSHKKGARKPTRKNEKNKDHALQFSKRDKNKWDRRDKCPYCPIEAPEVTHFPRHLNRHHAQEQEVRKLRSLPKRDPERNQIYDALRKRGNFQLFTEKKVCLPVRRPPQETSLHTTAMEYSPCPYCLGIYKSDFLYRHAAICGCRPQNQKNKKRNPRGDSQTLLAIHYGNHGSFLINSRLKQEVFPIMAADEISDVAKSDPLICIYGEAYLGKHKRVQMRNKVSNEIREFSRLLISLKGFTNVKCMMDVLDPTLFSSVVEGVKIISGYDTTTKEFKAPSLALHMRTNLDHLCAVGEKIVLQKHPLFVFENYEEKLKEIKKFRKLVVDHFTPEISSLALKHLNERKWQKQTAIPKTSNVEIFNNYLKKEAEEAYAALEKDVNNEYYYSRLVKATFALTVLINRKRIGEVQFLTIDTYERDFSGINLEEFKKSLTAFELELSTKFKRVITSGKGSRPVPILFPKRLERYIECILNVRRYARFVCGKDNSETKFVNKTNPYVFALPDTDHWLSGYHVLQRLAKESKIEDPQLMTSTRFRKHLATIMQLLTYEKSEMEQIARFMGHTLKTHEEFYRLPEDVYQTSKVAKVLMIMDEGKGEKYRGLNLKEIELDCDLLDDAFENTNTEKSTENNTPDDPDLLDNEDELDTAEENLLTNENAATENADERKGKNSKQLSTNDVASPSTSGNQTTSAKKNTNIGKIDAAKVIITSKGIRQKWEQHQKDKMKTYFKKFIARKQAPGRQACEEFLEKYKTTFPDRHHLTVRAFIYNTYKNM